MEELGGSTIAGTEGNRSITREHEGIEEAAKKREEWRI
jgi:hypothetical protein